MPRAFISVATASAFLDVSPDRAAAQHDTPLPAHAVSRITAAITHSPSLFSSPSCGVEAGVDEEQRHEQGRGQRLDDRAQAIGEPAAGYRHAQHEGAEDRVDADPVGEPGPGHQQHQHGAERPLRQLASRLDVAGQPSQVRPDQPEHDGGRDD